MGMGSEFEQAEPWLVTGPQARGVVETEEMNTLQWLGL